MQVNNHLAWIDFGIIGAYLALIVGVGYFISRKKPTFEQFFIAGRTMTTPILVCTLVSTYYGIDVLFGTSELGFNEGIVAWFGYSRSTYLFFIIAAFLLTRRLREANFRSLPDILRRYSGRPAGLIGALASFIYSLPALGLFGLGMVSEVVLGLDPRIGALLIGGIALVYTLWGGLWAVAITDTIQFVLMCLTLSIAIPIVMSKVGGFAGVAETMPTTFFEPLGGLPPWLVVIYAATGLSILVDPAFYQRIFAARDFRQARNALLIGILIWGAYDWCVTAGGMLAATAVQTGILPADTHPNGALLQIVTFALPVGLTGIFLAGTLSAAMSTIDSYSLVAGGNIVYDVYRPVFDPNASDDRLMRFTKWGITLSWGLGYVLAFYFERLLALWVFLSTILTATVLVPILAGLFWRGRLTRLAGLLSTATGFVSAVAFYLAVHHWGALDEQYATHIWTVRLAGRPIEIWQEYALFFSLPMSLVGFLLGTLVGNSSQPVADDGAER